MKNFKEVVIESLENYKKYSLKIYTDVEFRNNKYKHILDKGERYRNFISEIEPEGINYHMYSNHLNSSQVMCVNFFEPIKNDAILVRFIEKCIGVTLDNDVTIYQTYYEYIEDPREKTNFDFYVVLSNGFKIYFEIKYTEYGFGKISKDKSNPHKYEYKFLNIYKPILEKSKYLKCIDKAEFFKDYQIYRNISYIKDENSYVVFIYPFENDKCHKECTRVLDDSKVIYSQVNDIDWEDAYSFVYDEITNSDLKLYYHEFKKKYICWNI